MLIVENLEKSERHKEENTHNPTAQRDSISEFSYAGIDFQDQESHCLWALFTSWYFPFSFYNMG